MKRRRTARRRLAHPALRRCRACGQVYIRGKYNVWGVCGVFDCERYEPPRIMFVSRVLMMAIGMAIMMAIILGLGALGALFLKLPTWPLGVAMGVLVTAVEVSVAAMLPVIVAGMVLTARNKRRYWATHRRKENG